MHGAIVPYLCWWPLFNAPKLDVIVTAEQKGGSGISQAELPPPQGGVERMAESM
jgi:hypothetical protein